MTIEQFETVDGAGVDEGSRELVLIISDHLGWEDLETHTAALEGKISAYLNFIGSGQHLELHPAAGSLPVRINLLHLHEPSPAGADVLKMIVRQLDAMGIRFSFQDLPEGF